MADPGEGRPIRHHRMRRRRTVGAGGSNGFERLLNAAPIVWLGEISYEIFLLHVIMMEIVMASVLQWPVFTGSLPSSSWSPW